MKLICCYLLSTLFFGLGLTKLEVELQAHYDSEKEDPRTQPPPDSPAPTAQDSVTPSTTVLTADKSPWAVDKYLSSKCLEKRFTHLSCQKVFCPPWMRCLNGRCECKLPYQCLRDGATGVCSTIGRTFLSYCQLKAADCLRKTSTFSHFLSNDTVCKGNFVTTEVKGDRDVLQINKHGQTFLVCGNNWTLPTANVACRNTRNKDEGAAEVTTLQYKEIKKRGVKWPDKCVTVTCTGLENSLSECTIIESKDDLNKNTLVAAATCFEFHRECTSSEFPCVNGKCIPLNSTCDATNDCGDGSDEMCCKECRISNAFHCKSDVCIPSTAQKDGIVDCLGGEDEAKEDHFRADAQTVSTHELTRQAVTSVKAEIKVARDAQEKFTCGIPNKEQFEPSVRRSRRKRVIGGQDARKTQFPWQVAIQEAGSIDCGGTYIGGCWVLTAAHCVRPKPDAYKVKLSVWNKRLVLNTTDLVPIRNIIIHPGYNPTTYQNDIALIELEKLPSPATGCFKTNLAVAPACLPWSEYQFLPGDNCTISGWGRTGGEGQKTDMLRWANINIIGNCSSLYGKRYFEGMECAGSLDGSVDSCQGDSGGPLMCADSRGMMYVWGIVSWGEKCGVARQPGVYTKVAHYFTWITSHIGREAIMKYNI